jgi:hypothetical protein
MTPTIMKPKIASAARVWKMVTVSTTSDMTESSLLVLTAFADTAIA